MAEVTNVVGLIVVVLDEVEAAALTDLLYADSVDHENGTPALDDTADGLPEAEFLRRCCDDHCVARSYWPAVEQLCGHPPSCAACSGATPTSPWSTRATPRSTQR
jgi:hypothetical protein